MVALKYFAYSDGVGNLCSTSPDAHNKGMDDRSLSE
jgi:hypothetical protein